MDLNERLFAALLHDDRFVKYEQVIADINSGIEKKDAAVLIGTSA